MLLTTRDGPRARQKAEQRGLDRAVVLAHTKAVVRSNVRERMSLKLISLRDYMKYVDMDRATKTVAQERRR